MLVEDCQSGSLEVIACGIGTKSIPKKDYNTLGYVLIDMHAEVLAKRALQRYLVKDAYGPQTLLEKST